MPGHAVTAWLTTCLLTGGQRYCGARGGCGGRQHGLRKGALRGKVRVEEAVESFNWASGHCVSQARDAVVLPSDPPRSAVSSLCHKPNA